MKSSGATMGSSTPIAPWTQVAWDVAISGATLHNWKGRYRRFGANGSAPGGSSVKGLSVPQLVEVDRGLRREVQWLERQREAVK
jgi:hypothetical protein